MPPETRTSILVVYGLYGQFIFYFQFFIAIFLFYGKIARPVFQQLRRWRQCCVYVFGGMEGG